MLKRKKVVGFKTLVEPMNIRSYYCANGRGFRQHLSLIQHVVEVCQHIHHVVGELNWILPLSAESEQGFEVLDHEGS